MTDAGKAKSLEDIDWAQWFARNSRNLTIVGSVVAIAALGFWWYHASSVRKETFASMALEQARGSAEAGNLPLAASDLAKVYEQYKGTRAADQAALILASVRLLQGQNQVAVSGLQEFLKGSHPNYVEASAYGMLGGGLEQLGRDREAGQAYQRAADKADLDFMKAQYLIDAGRSLALGRDSAGAKAVLGTVLKKYGNLQQAAEARVRMAELGGAVPPPPTDQGQPNS